MTIQVGSEIPAVPSSVWESKPEATVQLPSSGNYILVGVPGAFTPPCSDHVPGYLTLHKEISAKGYPDVYILSINDVFVTSAWKTHMLEKFNSSSEVSEHVHFLADSKGEFSSALGMKFDASGLLGNERTKRFAAVVENGKVKTLYVEENPPDVQKTKAEEVLKQL